MRVYRCYFLDGERRLLEGETLSAEDDASARAAAMRVLQNSNYASAELWQGSRLIGVLHQRRSVTDI